MVEIEAGQHGSAEPQCEGAVGNGTGRNEPAELENEEVVESETGQHEAWLDWYGVRT